MAKPTIRNKIIREYLVKFPNGSYTSLSRKILKENPLIFDNVENIRGLIRKIVGSAGKDKYKDTTLFREHRKSHYELPESYANDYSQFEIKQSRILIISDLHFPYQDNKAITLALDYRSFLESIKNTACN